VNFNKERTLRISEQQAEPGETIARLRELSAKSFNQNVDNILLIYLGRVLRDDWTCEAAGIHQGSTVLVHFKISPSPTPPREEVKLKILRGIKRLSHMKCLYILAKPEFLEKLYLDLPELNTSTFALLQASGLFVKWIPSDEYWDELDDVIRACPMLDIVVWKAVQWAPKLRQVISPEHPNEFSIDVASDESDTEAVDEASNAGDVRVLSEPGSSLSGEELLRVDQVPTDRLEESQSQPRPGPSREPQPGPSQSRQITAPMLQAALQAEAATRTFAWQLGVMRDMGFADEKACLEALVKSGGDVDLAVNTLFQD